MRDYTKKAKSVDNGEWIEGFYFCMEHTDKRHSHHFIIPLGADLSKGIPINSIQVEVDPDTICEPTGLTDKNGNLIWEKDIVRTQNFYDRPYSDKRKSKRHVGIVQYKLYTTPCGCGTKAKWIVKVADYGKYTHGSWGDFYDCEVIGNIFDNPELLKVGVE